MYQLVFKMLAQKQNVPYQSLMKMYLSERVNQELRSAIGA